MWYLIEQNPEQPPAPRHWLGGVAHVEGRTIGRKHVHIRLKASSVSRTHAKLLVQKAPFFAHPHPHRYTTTVSIVDSSAYGTFLKYPEGHRLAQNSPNHHVRLDKNTPTQIFDGALLSFGAPAAWWRLAWHPILAVPSHLSNSERVHLAEIVTQSGLEVSDDWVDNATHLVTNICTPHSIKFLSALAAQAHVVTMAWADFVCNVVINAGQAIAGAQQSDAAIVAEVATRLPDEKRFIPEFKPADVELYGSDILKHVFDETNVKKRVILFQNITISFLVERRFARWSNIIELCGGHATLATPSGLARAKVSNAKSLDSTRRVIVIGDSPQLGNSLQTIFPEGALVKSLLSADLEIFNEDSTKFDFSQAVSATREEEVQDEDSDSDDRIPIARQANVISKTHEQSSELSVQPGDTDNINNQSMKYVSLDEDCPHETRNSGDSGVVQCGKKRARPMSDLVESPALINTPPQCVIPIEEGPDTNCKTSTRRGSRRAARLAAYERILRTMKQSSCTKETAEAAVVNDSPGCSLNGNNGVEVNLNDQPLADVECARAHEVDLAGRENMQTEGDLLQGPEQAGTLKSVDFVTDEHGWQQRAESLNGNDVNSDTSKREFFAVQPLADQGHAIPDSSTNREYDEKDVRPFRKTKVILGPPIMTSTLRYVDELNTLEMECGAENHSREHGTDGRNVGMVEESDDEE